MSPLERELIDRFLHDLPKPKQPLLIAFGGSPGAGKTTLRKRLYSSDGMHVHDLDEVMLSLSGYQADLKKEGARFAFEKWWPIAQTIAQRIVQHAIHEGYSILYDRTCGSDGSYFDFTLAKEKGYHISLTGLYADREVAKARVRKREKEEGRCVTEEIVDEYCARFSALWPRYLSLVDEAVLLCTNDEVPLLVYSSKEGTLHPKVYQKFLEEGRWVRN